MFSLYLYISFVFPIFFFSLRCGVAFPRGVWRGSSSPGAMQHSARTVMSVMAPTQASAFFTASTLLLYELPAHDVVT